MCRFSITLNIKGIVTFESQRVQSFCGIKK